jgi:hypothetical protein
MSNKSSTHGVNNVDDIEDSRVKREDNRKRLSRLLNPVSMSAEQNEGVRNYPTSGWQDEGSTGRWNGFRVCWGTYKVISDQDHALRFLTYLPESVADESCPLLISWHGGGFVSSTPKHSWTQLIVIVHRYRRLCSMGCTARRRPGSRSQSYCRII